MKDPVAELIQLAERAAAHAVSRGAEAAEALVSDGAELTAKVRLGEPELVQEAGARALGLRVFRDKRAAVTYTSDLSPDALLRFVDETVDLAQLSEPDPLNELPESFASLPLPELDLFDEKMYSVTASEALALAKAGEKAARGFSPKITNSDGATYSKVTGATAFAIAGRGREGFRGGYRSTYCSLTVEPIADDADGKKRNAYHWTASRFRDGLDDPEAVGIEAARRTVAKLGAEKIETGAMPVVFDPEAGRGLLRALFSVISGGAIYRRSSYLLDREGTAVASPLCTIVDDPLLPRAPGSRPFDGDGLASRKNLVVDAGVLRTYLLDTYSARKLNRASNGCAGRGVGGSPHVSTSNFILQRGTTPKSKMLDGIERGLYVTDLMGFGFNATTGDFSRGAGGFLIEKGELGRPVTEVTVSANFDALWKAIDRVGDDLDLRTSTACPTFRVAEMMIAGR
jgi:PmbA protein